MPTKRNWMLDTDEHVGSMSCVELPSMTFYDACRQARAYSKKIDHLPHWDTINLYMCDAGMLAVSDKPSFRLQRKSPYAADLVPGNNPPSPERQARMDKMKADLRKSLETR